MTPTVARRPRHTMVGAPALAGPADAPWDGIHVEPAAAASGELVRDGFTFLNAREFERRAGLLRAADATRRLSGAALGSWVLLWSGLCDHHRGYMLATTDTAIAEWLGVAVSTWRRYRDLLIAAGLLGPRNGGGYFVPDWRKLQHRPKEGAERVPAEMRVLQLYGRGLWRLAREQRVVSSPYHWLRDLGLYVEGRALQAGGLAQQVEVTEDRRTTARRAARFAATGLVLPPIAFRSQARRLPSREGTVDALAGAAEHRPAGMSAGP